MGFGLLFVGYLFAFGFTSGTNYIVSMIGILGAAFLFAASLKLRLYSRYFKFALYLSVAVGVSYAVNAILQLAEPELEANALSQAFVCSKGLIVLSVFLFNLVMYLGIAQIALIAEDKKLAISSYRNLVIMIIYYLCVAVALITGTPVQALLLIVPLLGLVWLILSVWLVISAYMRICLPEDKNMDDRKNK